jgi:hypothetical protein
MLLHIMEVFLSEPMRKARQFWRSVPGGLSFEQLLEKYPRGSDEYESFGQMMIFWETIGSLIKHGLINEDLAFDTFLDAPPWKKVENAFISLRQEEGAEQEGENLEYAYLRSMEWKARHSPSTS